MPIPDDWFDDETKPRTQEEMERAHGGKEAYEKYIENFIASLDTEGKDEPVEEAPTEDKFLPRRRR